MQETDRHSLKHRAHIWIFLCPNSMPVCQVRGDQGLVIAPRDPHPHHTTHGHRHRKCSPSGGRDCCVLGHAAVKVGGLLSGCENERPSCNDQTSKKEQMNWWRNTRFFFLISWSLLNRTKWGVDGRGPGLLSGPGWRWLTGGMWWCH
jgi:hypothetical protein